MNAQEKINKIAADIKNGNLSPDWVAVDSNDILSIAEAFRALEQRLSMEEKAKKCVHLMLVSAAQDLGLSPEEAGHPFINNAIFNLIQRAEAAEAKLYRQESIIPEGLTRCTAELVMDFAKALAEKLYLSEQKYGWSDGWKESDWQDKCLGDFHHHIGKGDPRDVAAYCAFMWHHEWPTRPAPAVSLAELVPTVCDGKEQEAFEEYARSKGLDLSQHPLYYLFLDGKTNQARSAWRECLVYVRATILRNIEEENNVAK